MYTNKVIGQLKSILFFAVFIGCSYVCHKILQHEYYKRCNMDVIQVLFFRNSHLCVCMANVITIIERSFTDLAGTLISHIV